jgi:hypothetical protein
MSAKRKKTLEDYEREHRQLAQRLARLGFLWQGSISRRSIRCGNPSCACQNDPDARHGPYAYWSSKKQGKTICRKLPTPEAELLSNWVDNRRQLKEIADQMMDLARKALPLALQHEAHKHDGIS